MVCPRSITSSSRPPTTSQASGQVSFAGRPSAAGCFPPSSDRERVVVQRHPLRTPMDHHRETRRQTRPDHRPQHRRPRPDRTQRRRRPLDRPDQLPDLPGTVEHTRTRIHRRHVCTLPSRSTWTAPTRPIVGSRPQRPPLERGSAQSAACAVHRDAVGSGHPSGLPGGRRNAAVHHPPRGQGKDKGPGGHLTAVPGTLGNEYLYGVAATSAAAPVPDGC